MPPDTVISPASRVVARLANGEATTAVPVVHALARRTPVLTSRSLSEQCGGRILMKAENLQRTGSFKLRGALTKLSTLERPRAVVAGSAGNHAQSLAYAARSHSIPCEVFMPREASVSKVAAVQKYGGDRAVRRRHGGRVRGRGARAGRGDRRRVRAPVRRPGDPHRPGDARGRAARGRTRPGQGDRARGRRRPHQRCGRGDQVRAPRGPCDRGPGRRLRSVPGLDARAPADRLRVLRDAGRRHRGQAPWRAHASPGRTLGR